MILEWLKADFNDLFVRDDRAHIALWFDAKREFSELIPVIQESFAAAGVSLLAFDRSQNHGALWLKWAAEMGPSAGMKVILWLPFGREDLTGILPDGIRLECLLEYVYSGLIWLIDGKPPTLFGFLRKHGVPLPSVRGEQDPLWRGGLTRLWLSTFERTLTVMRHFGLRERYHWR